MDLYDFISPKKKIPIKKRKQEEATLVNMVLWAQLKLYLSGFDDFGAV